MQTVCGKATLCATPNASSTGYLCRKASQTRSWTPIARRSACLSVCATGRWSRTAKGSGCGSRWLSRSVWGTVWMTSTWCAYEISSARGCYWSKASGTAAEWEYAWRSMCDCGYWKRYATRNVNVTARRTGYATGSPSGSQTENATECATEWSKWSSCGSGTRSACRCEKPSAKRSKISCGSESASVCPLCCGNASVKGIASLSLWATADASGWTTSKPTDCE